MAYNVDRAIKAHKRLMMKHRKNGLSASDQHVYFKSLERNLYHGTCADYIERYGRKLSKSEKSAIFKNASRIARGK